MIHRRKSKYFIKVSATFLSFFVCALLYCEFLHYYVVISQCNWPALNNMDAAVQVMAVADTHLLGNKNGHWFDKLRREWQMHRAFQSAMTLHKPDVVIFLGDLFDEGKWCNKEEFENYVARFSRLFYVPVSTEILIAAGNHDMGFHYNINPYLTKRFEEAFQTPSVQMKLVKGIIFITINSMALHGDDCFLCKPARLKVEAIAKELRCSQGFKEECAGLSTPLVSQYSRPVILQHYPLYRESDKVCDELDEAPAEHKNLLFRERWECLSREATEMLLRELQPRLVLSGHTHHGCQVQHNISLRDNKQKELISAHEYTVSSFSWRNKKNPTFAMLTVSNSDYAVYKCQMPSENTVVYLYIIFGILFVFHILKKKIRLGNFLYFKFCKFKEKT